MTTNNRGTKRVIEPESETCEGSRTEKRPKCNAEVFDEPDMVIDISDDDAETAEMKRHSWQHVRIELNPNIKPSDASKQSSRQATFDDLEWSVDETEFERQERLRRDAEEWQDEMELVRADEEAETEARAQNKRDKNRERQRKHRAEKKAKALPKEKQKKSVNDVCFVNHSLAVHVFINPSSRSSMTGPKVKFPTSL